ncbi:hypothetical protein BGZ98_009945 [Dissophora globulifera]|nr:hypothetical protein BGZ98_009945 [Dissophora globulifera]
MDPSLHEFYSLSRSTSQERPLSQIITAPQQRSPLRSSSRQQARPARAANTQAGIPSNNNQSHHSGIHTQDTSHLSLPPRQEASLYKPEDEYATGSAAEQYSRVDHLEDLDDYGAYDADQQGRGSRDASYDSNNLTSKGLTGTDGNAEGHGEGYGAEGEWDNTSMLLTPDKVTPLPKIPLFVLSVVIFSEPLTSTILFPFVYFMLTFPLIYPKNNAYFLGNVGVAKSMLGEIADHTNQSQAFSVFGFAWGIGMIVGPVLGGYLANPAKTFPDIFGDWAFFIEYPYFLPCFVAAMGSVVGFVVGYFFLEETKGRKALQNGDDMFQNADPYLDDQHNDRRDFDIEEDSHGAYEGYQPVKSSGPTITTTAPLDGATERQPLMPPTQASLPHQAASVSQENFGQSTQYGSMMTLTFDDGDYARQPYIYNTHTSTSARSTLSRRPIPTRPRLPLHRRGASASGHVGVSHSYVDRPTDRHSFYATRPMSSGGLFSLADPSSLAPQDGRLIPADATSLNLYGYATEAYTDGHDQESGRRSRMSVAPSQVYILPPDPKNKDFNQPMQFLVVQSEAGLSPLSITAIVAYAMLALHSIIFEEVYTLYAVTPVASHGLGWNAIQLSTSLASMGLVQLFLQFVVYPRLERRFSAVLLYRFAQLSYASLYIVFPLIRAFAVDESDLETGGQSSLVRYMVLSMLVLKYTSSVLSYTSVMVMLTNSSPPHLLGTVNGIGQTSASFVRAFGPALGGIVWAWSLSNKLSFPFNYFFVFFLISTIAILGFFHSLSIPRELGLKRF